MSVENIIVLCEKLKLKTISKRLHDFPNQISEWEEKHEHYLNFLNNLLIFECEHRQEIRSLRLLKEAKFSVLKCLESFDFNQVPHISEQKIRELSTGSYINNSEPIIFLGESGTGKTHLATAIGYHHIQQGHSVRFVSASHLANELMAAHESHELIRLIEYYSKFSVLIIDELGYLPLSKTDAELLFQVLSRRHERKPIIITTNLPFNEWTNIFLDKRLCRAVVDRVTHRAHIIETGNRSARLAETLLKIGKKGRPVEVKG